MPYSSRVPSLTYLSGGWKQNSQQYAFEMAGVYYIGLHPCSHTLTPLSPFSFLLSPPPSLFFLLPLPLLPPSFSPPPSSSPSSPSLSPSAAMLLHWQPSKEFGSPLTGYQLEYGISGSKQCVVVTCDSLVCSHTLKALSPWSSYGVRARVSNLPLHSYF